MSDGLKPIVGKSKVLEEQRRKEELIRRKKRKEEVLRRRKKQKIKAYATLAFLLTVIVTSCVIIVNILFPNEENVTGVQNKEDVLPVAKEDVDYVTVKNTLVTETLDISEIEFKDEDYIYTECDNKILKKLEEKLGESEIIDFIYKNREAYPEYLLKSLSNNSELKSFALKYPFEIKNEHVSVKTINTSDDKREVPLIIQWDDRWGYYGYGDDVIGLSGCGPTCLSMVMMALSDNNTYTPTYLADYAMNYNYYLDGSGTKWTLFTDGVRNLGFTSEVIEKKDEELKKALDEGKYLVLSMSKGIFTQVGHFIVIYDYTEDGKFVVNDPNSVERSNTTYSYEEFGSQIKNIWAIGNVEE